MRPRAALRGVGHCGGRTGAAAPAENPITAHRDQCLVPFKLLTLGHDFLPKSPPISSPDHCSCQHLGPSSTGVEWGCCLEGWGAGPSFVPEPQVLGTQGRTAEAVPCPVPNSYPQPLSQTNQVICWQVGWEAPLDQRSESPLTPDLSGKESLGACGCHQPYQKRVPEGGHAECGV